MSVFQITGGQYRYLRLQDMDSERDNTGKRSNRFRNCFQHFTQYFRFNQRCRGTDCLLQERRGELCPPAHVHYYENSGNTEWSRQLSECRKYNNSNNNYAVKYNSSNTDQPGSRMQMDLARNLVSFLC